MPREGKDRLELLCHKPEQFLGLPEPERDKEMSFYRFQREHNPLTPWFSISSLHKW